jgi:hypothetical protein
VIGWRPRHAAFHDGVRTLLRIAPERGRFVEVLAPLAAALRLHMSQEETVLLPATEGSELPPNGGAHVIRRDHELIRALLDEVRAEDVLARADALLRLEDVLEHHDRREAAGMLAVLDGHPSSEGWLARFRAEEAELAPIPALEPRPAPPAIVEDLPPLQRLRLAAAQDGPLDLAGIEVPDHSKGPRLHARLVAAVEAARTTDLVARRDALVDVLRAAAMLGHLRA